MPPYFNIVSASLNNFLYNSLDPHFSSFQYYFITNGDKKMIVIVSDIIKML